MPARRRSPFAPPVRRLLAVGLLCGAAAASPVAAADEPAAARPNAVAPEASGRADAAPGLVRTNHPQDGRARTGPSPAESLGVAVPTPASRPTAPAAAGPGAPPPAAAGGWLGFLDSGSLFEGLFATIGAGYATAGGEDGPVIPTPANWDMYDPTDDFHLWSHLGCLGGTSHCYKRAVTTNRGAGPSSMLQFGYNFRGLVSAWLDLSWHGSLGATLDMAGTATGALIAGVHPLHFVADGMLPFDLNLYAGWGFYEVLYYYHAEFSDGGTAGVAWTGTSIPFGAALEYKLSRRFGVGADMRFVAARYSKWIANQDLDRESKVDPAVTTFRLEPRLTLTAHF